MALIRLTQIDEREIISFEPVEMLINTRDIQTVTTRKHNDRIRLGIEMNGDTEPRGYAAIDSSGNNTLDEDSPDEVLETFRAFVGREG